MPKTAKNNLKNMYHRATKRARPIFLMSLAAAMLAGAAPAVVHAITCTSSSDCSNQITGLSTQNDQSQAQLSQLELQAEGYQGALSSLNAQIYSLESQISANQTQKANIEAQVAANEVTLTAKKASLAEDVKQMYIDGSMSTIEELATSKNLSDYVDKEQYRNDVQSQLNDQIVAIDQLQNTLNTQNDQINQILTSENTQNAQLSSAQAQQASLLNLNQSQQDTYNSQISANQSAISSLRRQQAALIEAGTRNVLIPGKSGGSGGACDNGYGNGTYPMPWCNAAQDTVATIPYSSDTINRECTSYAYWYFSQVEGHTDLRVSGNANQWLRTSNYPTHADPAVGSLAVETTGAYGHVAVVQALPGTTYGGTTVPDGYVLVSEMNYDWNGHFRYSLSPLSKFGGYIY
jgi:peptidoglycan hydrolase CwlO-like protein